MGLLTVLGLAFLSFAVLIVAVSALGAAMRRPGDGAAVPRRVAATLAGVAILGLLAAAAAGVRVGDADPVPPEVRASTANAPGARLPDGVTRWGSQYGTTCLVVRSADGADLGRRDARRRMNRLGLGAEPLCRF